VNDNGPVSCDNWPMREIKHTALVAQPPRRLFDLINDIGSYPTFIPWCTHAKVLSRSEREIVATIGVQRGPLHSEFTTRNELEPDRRVRMHLVTGPFKMLEGEWLLTPIAAAGYKPVSGDLPAAAAQPLPAPEGTGCRIQLTMKFAFKNALTAVLFEQKFAETAAALMDAFVARARALPP
jgi:ribosome-associated toxin RatA of RatAB toxin-antitoxin module